MQKRKIANALKYGKPEKFALTGNRMNCSSDCFRDAYPFSTVKLAVVPNGQNCRKFTFHSFGVKQELSTETVHRFIRSMGLFDFVPLDCFAFFQRGNTLLFSIWHSCNAIWFARR